MAKSGITGGNGQSKWRSPLAFLIVLTVVVGYLLNYVKPSIAPPVGLIPLGLLAAGYLFGVDYESMLKKKKGE
jgi:hypothetical protein